MRSVAIVLALSTAFAVWAATPVKKKNTAKASTAKASQSKAKSKGKSSAKKQTASRYRRSTQREPAPERYKEIQQSLAEKGYFAGPVNGTWGPDSVEALKRFQRDQNIGDDGKLGSLSLIALGLGPKRGTGSADNPGVGSPPP